MSSDFKKHVWKIKELAAKNKSNAIATNLEECVLKKKVKHKLDFAAGEKRITKNDFYQCVRSKKNKELLVPFLRDYDVMLTRQRETRISQPPFCCLFSTRRMTFPL